MTVGHMRNGVRKISSASLLPSSTFGFCPEPSSPSNQLKWSTAACPHILRMLTPFSTLVLPVVAGGVEDPILLRLPIPALPPRTDALVFIHTLHISIYLYHCPSHDLTSVHYESIYLLEPQWPIVEFAFQDAKITTYSFNVSRYELYATPSRIHKRPTLVVRSGHRERRGIPTDLRSFHTAMQYVGECEAQTMGNVGGWGCGPLARTRLCWHLIGRPGRPGPPTPAWPA